jgi:hypothetical protein
MNIKATQKKNHNIREQHSAMKEAEREGSFEKIPPTRQASGPSLKILY